MMPASSPWKSVAFGLNLKLIAMWMILPSILFPCVLLTHWGLLFAVLLPLLIDLVGRCYCARAPVSELLPIRLSIMAQGTGVLGLIALSVSLGLGGVILGLVWAIVFQFSAAKWFVRYLKSIALEMGEPGIAGGLDQLRQRLVTTTLSVYGSGVITIVVLICAIFFGMLAYGIGLIFTLPMAFLIVMPLLITCMVLYFLMLFSYERSLRQLREAISARLGVKS